NGSDAAVRAVGESRCVANRFTAFLPSAPAIREGGPPPNRGRTPTPSASRACRGAMSATAPKGCPKGPRSCAPGSSSGARSAGTPAIRSSLSPFLLVFLGFLIEGPLLEPDDMFAQTLGHNGLGPLQAA